MKYLRQYCIDTLEVDEEDSTEVEAFLIQVLAR